MCGVIHQNYILYIELRSMELYVGRYLGDSLRSSIQAMYDEPLRVFSLARLAPFLELALFPHLHVSIVHNHD